MAPRETGYYAESKEASLESVLGMLQQQLNVSFNYNSDLVKGKTTRADFNDATRENLSGILYRMLHPLGLSAEKINNRQYIIHREKTAGLRRQPVSYSDDVPERQITGVVTDAETHAPVAGVTVTLKNTSGIGTITDVNGKYALSVPENADTLVFSYLGYITREISVNDKDIVDVILQANQSKLNEVVVVGYGTQSKATVTGSISAVEGSQLSVAPVASTANTLAGRLPGLVSLQSSGQPGSDAASLSIRGFGGALVIVDGVESSFNNIDANEIESVTILKDGAASIYGARAGNGVILVTTKRGHTGKPTITLNSSYTLQQITTMPKPASSGQYAEMKREAWLQSGQPEATAPFTTEQIQKYYDGTDPLYPNTDWYHVLIRDWAPQQQHNLSVRGGSDRVRYYGFLGYLDQGTIWKKNGGNYKRYNIQSNIDADILDNLSLQLDISSILEDRRFPWRGEGAGANTVWQDFWNTLPIYPATLPDPTKISFADGGGTGGAHVVTNSKIAGYDNNESQNLKGTLALNYSFKAVRGLSAKALVNVLQDYSTNKHFTRPVQFYTYDPASTTYTLAGALGSKASLSTTESQGRTITGQFQLNYNHIFAQYHHLTALALYEVIDYSSHYLTAGRIDFLTPAIDQLFAGSTAGMTNNGSASEMGRKSYVGRINYDFKGRYLVETILRADASAKFPSDKRWGYFPSFSLGWVMSEENFMKNSAIVDNLKWRVSYGESGNDGVGNFQYLSGYQYGHTYLLDNGIQQGIVSTGLANPDLTWEKISIYNAGLDFSLWKRKLYGVADVFYRERKGIPATRITTLPSTFGSNLPPENINSLNDRGFELQLGTAGSRNDLLWDLSGNISWSRARWDHYEEPVYNDPDQNRIYRQSGRWTDRQYGYVSDGLFTSQKQIDDLGFDQDNQGNVSLREGDIRYKDTNSDGKLDWKDQVEIGKGTVPHWMFGFNINLKYKDFDLSTLFQGAFGYYDYIVLTHGNLPPELVYSLRWTEENNNPDASVPRLGGASTNGLTSDYYYKKAGYMRLKALSVGYNLPRMWLEKIGLSQVRFYFAANNILTFDKLKKYDLDPEAPSGNAAYYYPQQKTMTFGANISF
ncbi:TonB-dependent receptor [Compostibacter hankyongensis]|uniref:TonB-dependent receptor n=2 Tax=Compostibacter hankyongensis TaxID=1007089 RepID=A0ABP8FN28_9BACT